MKINWKKLFDWSVSGVQRYSRFDNGLVVYHVDVLYRHHGLRQFKFKVLQCAARAERESVYNQASAYFEKMRAKMHRDMNTR